MVGRLLRRGLVLVALLQLTSACFLVDENDTPQAVGQCVERAGGRASYPPPRQYAATAKGALVAHFSQGRAVLLFAGPGDRPVPPPAQPVRTAVGGRVAYWWESSPQPSESAALDHCLTTAHS
ncbi:MAG: hypothetical protein DLM67_01050 [Candidatus Nephthysia bennettiae]|uniref:C-type lysozyme inhibitor domain-containing protein n=1 Tax=Candidatus Nephthysia bennettiae TaxID=3127016 RepID=A0A934NFS8_9BACT|nr:hypothetical protein [Candidatus Dormibacteraeota bacterium]MBJ7613050.1 hypothetical protein [Candidatus Dormibacteraeota bacterium]PZS00536.1 MAG: hypothetical protein DLM67_01050 [Candidatus Dormibacteraeota bacterium]